MSRENIPKENMPKENMPKENQSFSWNTSANIVGHVEGNVLCESNEIEKIKFGIFSNKEIIDMSVCKIDNTKLTGSGSVYDERMGSSMDSNVLCVTCGKNSKVCTGHFGHIELNEAIIHPLFYKSVVSFLRCFCFNCNRLLITEHQIELNGFFKFSKDRRYDKIVEKVEKIDMCCHCNNPQPNIAYSITDNVISMVYKDKNLDDAPITSKNDFEGDNVKLDKNKKVSVEMSVVEIHKILDNISDEDVVLCGFDPSRIHPRNFIMSVFPVIPPCARPYAVADGNICDDDLTNQLIEIIKFNNNLKKDENETVDEKNESKRQKDIQSLKFRILTFYNNSQGKAKHPTNGRSIKGLKERMTGKEGQIRNNLMGKRVEFSGRTVIGPDPKLKLGEMGVPQEIAEELTVPEKVTVFNKDYLSSLVNSDKANFLVKPDSTRINLKYAMFRKGTELLYGDIVIRPTGNRIVVNNDNVVLQDGDRIERNGILLSEEETFAPSKKRIELNIGDEVHRHLKDGDIVLLNRQPTLHRGSMLAKKIKVMKGKTFRFNLGSTKTFNADFDGDEMNIHIPQSYEARAELEYLASTRFNIISAQGSKPIIQIVQDSLAGMYMMTRHNESLSKEQFFNILINGEKDGKMLWSAEREEVIKKILRENGKPEEVYNGRGLVSFILPEDFNYEKKNDAHPDEPIVKIRRGVLYEGTFDKNIIGGAQNNIVQFINKEYGEDMAAEFIDNVHFMANNWLLVNGFSIGLQDCLINDKKNVKLIQDKISTCYLEADEIALRTQNAGIKEVRVTGALNKAKDVGMKIAKDDMVKTNNLLSTVMSGSKGDFFNIAQLTGLVGQQNIVGERVEQTLSNGKRTLFHYPFGKLPSDQEYESRGFVRHSFIEGLNPQEFFFHAAAGRCNITDTAMGTAKSGYIQRRMVKITEDIQIKYDGTVRDAVDNIYQMAYGDNGINPCDSIKVNGKLQACDVSRVVDRLNTQFEIFREGKEEIKEDSKEQKEEELEDELENEPEIKIKEVEKVVEVKPKKRPTRAQLLKDLFDVTGKKSMYSGVNIDGLIEKLESLKLGK